MPTSSFREAFRGAIATAGRYFFLALIFLALGFGFFFLRQTHRMWYGAVELVVALVAMAYAINKMAGANFTSDDTIKLIGGIYIMVRGLQNVDDGLKCMAKTEEKQGIQNGIASAWYQLWQAALYPSSSSPKRGERMLEALERILDGRRVAAAQKPASGAEAPTASS